MSFNVMRRKVLVLSGKCPAVLTDSSIEHVEEWMNTIDRFKKPDDDYQVSVYRYWARQQLFDQPTVLKEVLENISTIKNSNETVYSLSIRSN